MKKMYNSIPELYEYVHSVIPLQLARYRPRLLELGDIYRCDAMALYCGRTGKMLGRLDGSLYCEDRFGNRRRIMSIRDIERAFGDIYTQYGKVLIPFHRIQDWSFSTTSTLSHKAQQLVWALALDGLKNELEYFTVSNSIKTMHDLIDAQYILERPDVERAMLSVRNAIIVEIVRSLETIEDHDWRSVHMQMDHRLHVPVLEVGMDIRIREYYERRIRQAAEQELEAAEHDIFSALR